MYSNPLRVLDTKNPELQEMADSAPRLFDFLGEESLAHYAGVCERLDEAGIAYELNPRMVRGLDYYNLDRKSTRLNSSHVAISYAVFCLKKKNDHGYASGQRRRRRDNCCS